MNDNCRDCRVEKWENGKWKRDENVIRLLKSKHIELLTFSWYISDFSPMYLSLRFLIVTEDDNKRIESSIEYISHTSRTFELSCIRVANRTKGLSICHVYSGRTRRVGKSMAFGRPSRCSLSLLSFGSFFRSSPFFLSPPILDDGSFSWNEFCWLSNGSLFLSLSSFSFSLFHSLPPLPFSPDDFDPSLQQ